MRDLWVELLRLKYYKVVAVVLLTPPAIVKGLRVPRDFLEVALEAFIVILIVFLVLSLTHIGVTTASLEISRSLRFK
jgi:hypothetical protein